MNLLRLNQVTKTFNQGTLQEKAVFQDLSLTVESHDFITIIGSNGAGKSTLLNIIAGDETMDSGSIDLDDQNITNQKAYKRSRSITRVFQNPAFGTSPEMTITENLSLVYNKQKRLGLTPGVTKSNESYFKTLVSELHLGLEHFMDTKVGLLSGGQRQALSLLMATMSKPRLLLLDEHTAALDPNTAIKINQMTTDIVTINQIPTLMVTHNMQDAIEIGNRLLMMDQGKIILDMKGEEKRNLTPDQLLELFKTKKNLSISDRMLFN